MGIWTAHRAQVVGNFAILLLWCGDKGDRDCFFMEVQRLCFPCFIYGSSYKETKKLYLWMLLYGFCYGCATGVLQRRDGYKETQYSGMYRQSETRAGNHRRHTRTRNASPPTQANHTARGARKQPNPPTRAPYMQLAKTPHTHQTTPRATSAADADPAMHHTAGERGIRAASAPRPERHALKEFA